MGGLEISQKRTHQGNVLYVSNFTEGTPAARSGIRQGDLLASIDGKACSRWTVSNFCNKLRQKGATTKLIITRAHQTTAAAPAAGGTTLYHCPKCQTKLAVPNGAPQSKCGACGQIFAVAPQVTVAPVVAPAPKPAATTPVTCFTCNVQLQAPAGAPQVQCYQCRGLINVPAQGAPPSLYPPPQPSDNTGRPAQGAPPPMYPPPPSGNTAPSLYPPSKGPQPNSNQPEPAPPTYDMLDHTAAATPGADYRESQPAASATTSDPMYDVAAPTHVGKLVHCNTCKIDLEAPPGAPQIQCYKCSLILDVNPI